MRAYVHAQGLPGRLRWIAHRAHPQIRGGRRMNEKGDPLSHEISLLRHAHTLKSELPKNENFRFNVSKNENFWVGLKIRLEISQSRLVHRLVMV